MTPSLITDLGNIYATALSSRKIRYGIFECGFCKNTFKSPLSDVKIGRRKSCGCLRVKNLSKKLTKHGFASKRIYSIWKNMIARCQNPKSINYKYYGGKGVSVCEKWKTIDGFVEDMGASYVEGLTIDRIDSNGNYELLNCRWITLVENIKRNIKLSNEDKIKIYNFYTKENISTESLSKIYNVCTSTILSAIKEIKLK